MSLTKAGINNGAIDLQTDSSRWTLAKGAPIADSLNLKARLQAANAGRAFPLELMFYTDSDGNDYLIVGPPPSSLPDPVQERLDAGEKA